LQESRQVDRGKILVAAEVAQATRTEQRGFAAAVEPARKMKQRHLAVAAEPARRERTETSSLAVAL
jgi:hypothetical protein